jgi:hypothetical protein
MQIYNDILIIQIFCAIIFIVRLFNLSEIDFLDKYDISNSISIR